MKMFLDNFKIAFNSIFSNKARSFLTVLGVIIGVGSVVLMLAIGEGAKNSVSKMIESFGTNVIFVVPGKIEKGKSFNPVATVGENTLTNKDVEDIQKKVDKIKDVAPISLLGGSLVYNKQIASSAIMVSSTPALADAMNGELGGGRYINDDDINNKSKVVVIGSAVKDELFSDQDPVGKKVTFRDTTLEIIGYTKKKEQNFQFGGFSFAGFSTMPRTTAIDITKSDQIFRIICKADSNQNVDAAVSQIKSTILDNHKGTEDFSVLTQDDILGIAKDILDLLTILVASIAAISLIVGGIGIMNMMLVTVTERTREIGIRKAVGAKNSDILIQFMIEAIVVSFMGGLLGVLLAFAASFAVDRFTPLSPVIDLNFILIAFSISFIVGVIFGLAPAIRASRKDPIESLRYE